MSRHWLVITRNEIPADARDIDFDDIDLDVEHEDCERVNLDMNAWGYNCAVEYEMDCNGSHAFDVEEIRPLAPGRYEIESWSVHYAAGPWGGDEWDGGLCLKVNDK